LLGYAVSQTLLCVSVTTATVDETLAVLNRPDRRFDVAEVRLDYLHRVTTEDVRRLLEARDCPVIVTNRPEREGGRWRGEERQRLDLLAEADRQGADYVDVEMDALGDFQRHGNARLIVSYHNYQETPANLGDIAREIDSAGADVVKLATQATSLTDNLRVIEVLRAARKPTIALTMGEHGHVCRVLGPKFGAFLVFASLGQGQEAAPGQIPVDEMLDLYHFRNVGPATAVYGVVANPVAHSMSPAIHNAAFAERGVDAVYLPFRVDDVAEFIPPYRDLPVSGYSVTIPHKEAVIPLLDEVQPLAKRIGAVNTIVDRGGRLCGSNTDWSAAVAAIESGLEEGERLDGQRVLMIGAGGAARAMAFGLAERGCRLTIANRTHERAVRLAQDVGCECVPLEEVGSVPYDVFVNGTSLGMHPKVEGTPLEAEHLRPGTLVFDTVYNPIETRLLREARAAGCRTVSGLEMFVNQATEQFELWTGQPAPRSTMRAVVERRLATDGD
jgi:3-dehydroquinate dehydratase/shikimate dehydrogenase